MLRIVHFSWRGKIFDNPIDFYTAGNGAGYRRFLEHNLFGAIRLSICAGRAIHIRNIAGNRIQSLPLGAHRRTGDIKDIEK
jgi:hypothetical protein